MSVDLQRRKWRTSVLLAIAFGVTAMCVDPPAHAQMATARVDELLKNLLSMADHQCAASRNDPTLKNLKAQGKTTEAFQAETSIRTLCVCMPSQVRTLLNKLPAAERETRVTQEEFARRYVPKVMSPCAGDALKAAYGEGCAERMAPYRPDTAKYCGCMASRLDELTEAEIGQMAKDNADYMPLAAAAKQKGQALPKRPPSLEQMKAFDEGCAAK